MYLKRIAQSTLAATACAAVAAVGVPSLSGAAHAESSVVVSTAGDIACGPKVTAYNGGDGTATQCAQKRTAALLPGSDQVWTLGDHVYPTATLANLTAGYDPTWGQFKGITKPSPGDHDYAAKGGVPYRNYFGVPDYYSFDVGAWHVISLNSEVDHSAGSTQEQWLQQDLASTNAQCVAAYWGAVRWSSGKKDDNPGFDPFWQDLYAAHADLVLGGDVHNYERFAPQDASGNVVTDGIRQFTVGTGGRSLDAFPLAHRNPNSQVRIKEFGVLRLALHDASYDWQFINETGLVRDSGSATCS